MGCFQLSRRLAQLDLIGRRIDREQEIAFVDDIAVFEGDLCERAADLSAQFDAVDGRELAQKLEPAVDIPLKRGADRDKRWRRPHGLFAVRCEKTRARDNSSRENGQRGSRTDPSLGARFS